MEALRATTIGGEAILDKETIRTLEASLAANCSVQAMLATTRFARSGTACSTGAPR
jgi:hypothetical protein